MGNTSKIIRFIPKRRDFWLYNGIGFGLFFVLNMTIRVASGDPFLFNLGGTFLWVVLCILSGLIFRWRYHRRNWQSRSVIRLLPNVLIFAVLSGLVIGIILGSLVYFSSITFLRQEILERFPAINFSEIFLGAAVANSSSSIFLITIWCAIYLGIVSNRRERQAELAQLKLRNSLQEAQLNTLAGQINPHFLFNALNNVRFMMHKDIAGADDMLVSLSEILRYSLTSSQSEKVMLETELDIVGKYMALVKIQLGDNIDFQFSFDPEIRNCLVPPMLVQMLVENAIKHGINTLEEGGTLTVSATAEDNMIRLSVENTIAAHLNPDFNSGGGIGLNNIRKRLSLLYRGGASFDIRHANAKVIARATLPREMQA